MGKRKKHKKKNDPGKHPPLQTVLLAKAILDILIALLNIIDKMKE